MVNVREATLEDREAFFALLRQLMASLDMADQPLEAQAEETFARMVEGRDGTILVAEEDGTLLGLVTLSYPVAIRCGGIYSCIEEFIVSEKARGKGVGGKLLEAVIQKASEKGSYEIQVNRPSELGYPIYLRHGWQDLGKHLNLVHPGGQKGRNV